MKLEDCIKRIDNYMQIDDSRPRLVDIQNCDDMKTFCSHFRVGSNVFKDVADYANFDENPSEADLYNDLHNLSGNVFITGFTTFYKLFGEQKLKELLKNLLSFTTIDIHLVVVCYQCKKQLDFLDPRMRNLIYIADGDTGENVRLEFSSLPMQTTKETLSANGIQSVPYFIENHNINHLYVNTKKKKSNYIYSLIDICEQKNAYSLLCSVDSATNELSESFGTTAQWEYALKEISKHKSWYSYVADTFGGSCNLDSALTKWEKYNDNERWMYFISLKLFSEKNGMYLSAVAKNTDYFENIEKELYQKILDFPYSNNNFWKCYNERRLLINYIGISDIQVANYCDWVVSKGKNAIYYLSDMTKREIYLIFKTLNDYREDYTKSEIMTALEHTYPALYQYLQTYDYKNQLLNNYFDLYKFQKVTNYIQPEFLHIVEEQALKRDYIRLLPARCEKTESIDVSNTLVYFMDAMGVEFLSFILAKCRENNLIAYTTLCHCELPSVTAKNKDFIDVFKNRGADFAGSDEKVSLIDDVKHHGSKDCDLPNDEIPSYLSRELEIIERTVKKSATDLQNYKKVILISDHGSSRLAVINNSQNKYKMCENGEHSGRCCRKTRGDEPPSCAIDSEDYWTIANYDSFKGGRMARFEVHGGATLEEVVVPIIEITKAPAEYEFKMLTEKIKFSKRKKNAQIVIFSKSKIDGISVRISTIDKLYFAKSSNGQQFTVSIPELKKSAQYSVDIYLQDNLLKSGLKFCAENTDFKEKDIL